VADVLAAHAHHIAAPLCGVEQQREREARLRADRMMRLELRDLIFRPRVESVALDGRELDVCRRVGAQVAALDPKLTERAQLRAACGGLLSSSASIHSDGNSANGRSPYAAPKRSRIPRRMRLVPALFEPKNCSESLYSAMTAATLPGLTRPAPMAVRGPLIAFSYSAMKLADQGKPLSGTRGNPGRRK